jgi:hypothetical protein
MPPYYALHHMMYHDDAVARNPINIDYKNTTLYDEYRPVEKADLDI